MRRELPSVSNIIQLDDKLKHTKEKKAEIIKKRKILAVQKVFQCTQCAFKCEKCGTQIHPDEPALRARAAFANDLCALVSLKGMEGQDVAFERLVEQYAEILSLDSGYIYKLFRAGLEKLDQDAGILEFDTKRSPFCDAARVWLERVDPQESEEAEAAAS